MHPSSKTVLSVLSINRLVCEGSHQQTFYRFCWCLSSYRSWGSLTISNCFIKTKSRLSSVSLTDRGIYTCQPASVGEASISLHVVEGADKDDDWDDHHNLSALHLLQHRRPQRWMLTIPSMDQCTIGKVKDWPKWWPLKSHRVQWFKYKKNHCKQWLIGKQTIEKMLKKLPSLGSTTQLIMVITSTVNCDLLYKI